MPTARCLKRRIPNPPIRSDDHLSRVIQDLTNKIPLANTRPSPALLVLCRLAIERFGDVQHLLHKGHFERDFPAGLRRTGLIEIDQFYSLLAEKAFPASTWIRKRSQLDYPEEPDMFHDSFGHLPLLVEHDFAEFTHRLGLLGQKHSQNEELLIQLQRIYWYTLEFGLINENGVRKAYGAGLMSSGGEIEFAMSPKPEVLPFRIDEAIARPFDSMSIQELYFAINDFKDLHKALDDWEKGLT